MFNDEFTACAPKMPEWAAMVRRRVGAEMRDWVADWNKWSRAERLLAVLVTFVLLALPLGLLITGKSGV